MSGFFVWKYYTLNLSFSSRLYKSFKTSLYENNICEYDKKETQDKLILREYKFIAFIIDHIIDSSL